MLKPHKFKPTNFKKYRMKKNYTLLLIILISIGAFAQAPNKLNYQGLIRNSVGNPLGNTPVILRISILDIAHNVLFLELEMV